MIRNERQFRAAQAKRRGLASTREGIASPEDREAYEDLIAELDRQLAMYRDVREGRVRVFNISGLDDLAGALINARLSNGWTQRQLADALGVSEQMVSKDEARDYENAGIARLAEILDLLDFELVGSVRPRTMDRWRGQGDIASAAFGRKITYFDDVDAWSSRWRSSVSVQIGAAQEVVNR